MSDCHSLKYSCTHGSSISKIRYVSELTINNLLIWQYKIQRAPTQSSESSVYSEQEEDEEELENSDMQSEYDDEQDGEEELGNEKTAKQVAR